MTDENTQGKKAYLYDQGDVSYTPLSTQAGQACGGCRWFNDMPMSDTMAYGGRCQLVQSYPLPIRETGWCSEFDAIPAPQPDYNEVMEELVEVLENKERKPVLAERFKEGILALLGMKARDEPITSGFKSLGNRRWVGWYSNNFEDLQGEFFPARATDEFIDRLDRKEIPMPELYFWHVPFRFGEAKAVARIALDSSPNAPSFTVAVGEYDDTPIARAFEKAIGKREYPMSHGFSYAPVAKIGGAYHYYDTFEVSPLPPHAPANPFTLFEDKEMPILDNDKRKELVSLLGEDYVKEIETKAETRLKERKEQGIAYKEIPAADNEARAKLDELSAQIKELTETVKAKMPMMEEDEEDDKKKKADDDRYGAMKKDYDAQIAMLTQNQKALADAVKGFLDLTPRRASKDMATLVPSDDPALKELQAGAAGEKSNEDRVFNAAFGALLKGANNGA